jgi:DnaJ-domain-containing protein 1
MDGGIRGRYSPAAKLKDPFGVFGNFEPDTETNDGAQHGLGTLETQALVVLDLRPPVTIDAVKARYKELVKRHHPDTNGGDKTAEEKFKLISQAYQTIMNNLAT